MLDEGPETVAGLDSIDHNVAPCYLPEFCMYHTQFGLDEPPFSIAVDPRYLYMSARHREALAHLLYGVGVGGGFILLTGEVGTGKTTIIRCLLEQLPEKTDIALVLNPALNAEQLLATVCGELAIPVDRESCNLKELTDLLHRFLLRNHENGRNTVLLIDEAQHLSAEVLEQVRLLTNLETTTRKLLQIVLVGQPELKQKLAKPELRQLSQRITARCELAPLTREETSAYIQHRLQVAGLSPGQQLFSGRQEALIHRFSGGIPRVINVLCDRVLLGCYGRDTVQVNGVILRQAMAEVRGERKASRDRQVPATIHSVALASLLLTTLAALGWWLYGPVAGPGTKTGGASVAAIPLEPLPVPSTERAPEPVSAQPWRYQDQQAAVRRVMLHRGEADVGASDPCTELALRGWRCDSLPGLSLSELAEYSQPLALEVLGEAGDTAWLALTVADGEVARAIGPVGEIAMPLPELAQSWTGRFVIPWLPPPGYRHAFRRGSYGDKVNWLAKQFAQLDGEQRQLANQVFNARLEQRVKLFQRQENLTVDGIVGMETLLRIQRRIDEQSGSVPALAAANGSN